MKKKRGFTLVELLVVISIIALLMAILMPALASVKRQARAAACLSNLRQWGVVFTLYLGDNNGYFNKGNLDDPRARNPKPPTAGEIAYGYWLGAYFTYYKDPVLLCCPVAHRIDKNGVTGTWKINATNLFEPIKPLCRYAVSPDNKQPTIYGSYTFNRWLTNPPGRHIPDRDHYFRTSNQKKPANIPVLCDVFGRIGGYNFWWINPQEKGGCNDERPDNTFGAAKVGGSSSNQHGMRSILMGARHSGGIQMLFADWSAKWSGLKALWTYKWHKQFDIHNEKTLKNYDWPSWMDKLRQKAK